VNTDATDAAGLQSGIMAHNLHCIVFSKDRACQCASLLESLSDHLRPFPASLTVLYRASTSDFAAGYALAQANARCDNMIWRPEISFETDVRGLVFGQNDSSLVMFLVDDDIVFREAELNTVLDFFTKEHLFVSLRASRSYTADQPPEFTGSDPCLRWQWNFSKRKLGTWNYPFSVDGNIFHAGHLKRMVNEIDFAAPNSFEGNMHARRHAWWVKRIKYALAPKEAVVFNNPLNRVQTEGETRHAGVSAQEINQAFLTGMRIDNATLYDTQPTETHFEAGIPFVKDRQ
jgi:hypothetical protein